MAEVVVAGVSTLYHGPLEDFVGRRNDLVRTLRSTDADAARAAGKLRKPPVTVWAIDQLAVEDRDLLAQLLAAGADARHAQQAALADPGSGEDLLLASGRLREKVEAAVRAAAKLASGAGHATGEDTVRRMRTTLQAAATGSAAERVAIWHGTLDQELDSTGFAMPGDLDDDAPELATVLAPLRRAPSRERDHSTRVSARPVGDLSARRAAERALAEHRAAADRARTIADAKRQQAERLIQGARTAEEEAAAAERAARDAEDAASAAQAILDR